MENVHEQLLQLLTVFDRVCQEHDVRYTLHGGTLLGAVREKGFIPWDDDVDVAMTRQEFEKLQLFLQGDSQYYIVGNIKKQFRKKGDNSVWVDIFVCDFISQKALPRKLKLLTLTMLDVMNRDKTSIRLSDFSKYGKAKRIAFKAAYLGGKLLTAKYKGRLYEKVSRRWWTGNKTTYFRSNDQYSGREKAFPVQWLDRYIYVPFAETTFCVSACYHELLVSFYGDNYMTPIKDIRNTQVHDLVRTEGDITL